MRPTNAATCRSFAQSSEHDAGAFRFVANRAGKTSGDIATEFQRGSFAESRFRAVEQFGKSDVLYTTMQSEHTFKRIMCDAVVTTFVLNAVEVVPHSVGVYSFTVKSWLPVQIFDRFLNLECGDERRGNARGGNVALLNGVAREHGAGKTISNQLSICFVHRAFVTGSTCRIENSHDSRETFDRSVNPCSLRAGTGSIHKHSRLAIVESANDNVGPHKSSETKLVHDVLRSTDGDRVRIQFRNSFRCHFSFECAGVSFLKQNCTAEIAHLNPVHVKNHDVAHATESQKFKNLIS